LALLGRLPSAHADGNVMQASEKPAQTRTADRDRPTGGFMTDSRLLRQGRILEIAAETANDAVA
jgi:hypothetical protein